MLKRSRIHTALKKSKKRPATIVTSIRMLPKLKQQIAVLAKENQRTTNSLIVRALTKYVQHENRDDWAE